MAEVTLWVKGMTCGGCVRSVERVLGALPGVATVNVSLAEARAVVTHDAAQVGAARMQQAVAQAGFEAGVLGV